MWMRPSINKVVKVDVGIVGDCAYVLADMLERGGLCRRGPEKSNLDGWFQKDPRLEGAQLPRLLAVGHDHQAAIRGAASLRGVQGPQDFRHHRGRPAPDVGARSTSSSTSRTGG